MVQKRVGKDVPLNNRTGFSLRDVSQRNCKLGHCTFSTRGKGKMTGRREIEEKGIGQVKD